MPKASPNLPDLGFPKGQLLFVAKVQGHVLGIVHQGLRGRRRRVAGRPRNTVPPPPPLQAWPHPCGCDSSAFSTLHAICGPAQAQAPGSRISSSRFSQRSPQAPPVPATILPRLAYLHPPHTPPPSLTCFILPRVRLEPSPQTPAPPLATEGLGCLVGPGGGGRGGVGACAPRCRLRAGRRWGRGARGPERSRGLGRGTPRPWWGRGLQGPWAQGLTRDRASKRKEQMLRVEGSRVQTEQRQGGGDLAQKRTRGP